MNNTNKIVLRTVAKKVAIHTTLNEVNDFPTSGGKIKTIQINNVSSKEMSAKLWHKIDWKLANEEVSIRQESILKYAILGDWSKVYKEQRNLIKSFSGRALAIRRVVTNSGGKTPGIDGITLKGPAEYFEAIGTLKTIISKPKEYKALPVKRVYIPKPGKKEKIGLGIPTITDRTVQAIYQMAIDPVVEHQSDPNSFGFRKERSTLDAVSFFRNYMDKNYAPWWVLEADITKCFDQISHDFLLKHTPICDKNMLKEWLKAGIMSDGVKIMSEEGTPQGGIISPLLANIALNGLEKEIKEHPDIKKVKQNKIKIIRYADDIVITGIDEEILIKCRNILENFLAERGLSLNKEKTRISNIEQGIDLLGFNIKRQKWDYRWNAESKQKYPLIIKPSDKAIDNIKSKISKTIWGNSIKDVVINLNPILRGWAEYFRITPHSRKAFFTIDDHVWQIMRSKFVRSRQGRRTIGHNFSSIHKGKGRWGNREGALIFNLARTGISRLRLKRLDLNPYMIEHKDYFNKLKELKVLSKLRTKLYKKYNHMCGVCGGPLNGTEKVEIHHIKAKKNGGSNRITNLMPLHKVCHSKVTHEKSI